MAKKLNNQPVLFLARKEGNGKYTIYDVDVFGMGAKVPTTAIRQEIVEQRTQMVTSSWMDQAVDRAEKMRAETGYVPPCHIWHNEEGSNDNREKVGFPCELRRGDGKGLTYKVTDPATGQEVWIARAGDPNRLYVNLRGVEADVFENLIAKDKLPYRSVEITDTEVPDISSLALMFSTPPFFALRPLSIHLDTSKQAETFRFQPAALAGAQFKAPSARSFYTTKGEPSMLKFTALAKMMRAQGLADTPKEAHAKLRLMFAADEKPPEDGELKKAADEAFAADDAADPEDKEKMQVLPTEIETEAGGKKPTPPEEIEKKKGEKGKPTPPEEISSAKEGGASKDLNEGGAMLNASKTPAKFAGDPPPKPEEKKTDVPEGDGDEAINEKAAAEGEKKPEAGAQPPAAPATPPAPSAPPAVSAPPAAEVVQANNPGLGGGVNGGIAGGEVPGATVSLLTIIHESVEETLQQALAPLVQEVRGMLSNQTAQGAPGGVDLMAPMVAMRASFGFGSRFSAIFNAKLSKVNMAPAAQGAPLAAKPAQTDSDGQSAQFNALQSRLSELEAERTREKRVAMFRNQINEAIAEANGMIRLDVELVANTAADMPVRKAKFLAQDGSGALSERQVDMGHEHIKQVLSQAGAMVPPPPIGFAAGDNGLQENGKQVMDPDVSDYAGHTRALQTAQIAAKTWDDDKRLQKFTARRTFITSEVYSAHKVEPKKK